MNQTMMDAPMLKKLKRKGNMEKQHHWHHHPLIPHPLILLLESQVKANHVDLDLGLGIIFQKMKAAQLKKELNVIGVKNHMMLIHIKMVQALL